MNDDIMFDGGTGYRKTDKGFVPVDEPLKPGMGQVFFALVNLIYAWLIGTVIYQLHYPTPNEQVGTMSMNLLLKSQHYFGDAVLLLVAEALFLATYALVIRTDVASRLVRATLICIVITWFFADFCLLYGFEDDITQNTIARYTVGILMVTMGKSQTMGLYWLCIAVIAIKVVEHHTGLTPWTYVADLKKKAVVNTLQLSADVKRLLPKVNMATLPKVAIPKPAAPKKTVAVDVQPLAKEIDMEALKDIAKMREVQARTDEVRARFNKSREMPKPVVAAVQHNLQSSLLPPETGVMSATELANADIPEVNMVLPWLQEAGLAMISADAGIGKTRFTLALMHALSCGQSFLGWDCFEARTVLYIDGEMGKQHMRDRLRPLGKSDKLLCFSYDMVTTGFPNVCTVAGQNIIERVIKRLNIPSDAVIVLDSLKTLSELSISKSTAYAVFHTWILSLKKRGHTVIMIHHNNKDGVQDGSNDKRVAINTEISLRMPVGYKPTKDETRFTMKFEKVRESYGYDFSESEIVGKDSEWARSTANGNVYTWGEYSRNIPLTTPHRKEYSKNIQDNQEYSEEYSKTSQEYSRNIPEYSRNDVTNITNARGQVLLLRKQGKTQIEIARLTGLSQSQVSKVLADMTQDNRQTDTKKLALST